MHAGKVVQEPEDVAKPSQEPPTVQAAVKHKPPESTDSNITSLDQSAATAHCRDEDFESRRTIVPPRVEKKSKLNKSLRDAAKDGNLETVEVLLSYGADVAAKDYERWTALHRAARNGHEAVVALLLRHMDRADVAARDWSEGTAFHYAAENGHRDVVALLLGRMAVADVASRDQRQRTALHYAAGGGHGAVVALLLSHGADITARDQRKRTALHRAAGGGNGAVVALLLSHGADVAARDVLGQTALDLAKAGVDGAKARWQSEQEWERKRQRRKDVVAVIEKWEKEHEVQGGRRGRQCWIICV